MPSSAKLPPGPRGKLLLGLFFEFRKDLLGLLVRSAHEYGDMVSLPIAGRRRILLNHPDLIGQVLVMQQQKFRKSALAQAITRPLLGNGLLNSEGEFWKRQRRLAQPAFQKSQISEYAPAMVEQAIAHSSAWHDGEVRDVATEMSRLTCSIAVKTLFGLDLGPEADRVSKILPGLMRYTVKRARSPLHLPASLPTPANRRARTAFAYVNDLIYRLIEERRSRQSGGSDLLSRFIAATDEDGSHMTPQQLRDETITMFFAGHETTALTLSWTWYLLSQNHAAEARLHEELSRVLAGRTPRPEDAESLPYLMAVIYESLRLYPPAFVLGSRTANEPVELGGYSLPAGTTVLMSPWVMHRDARYFTEPLAFRPERWLDGLITRLPPYAYFPFGGGPRRCIGQGFAMMEALLVTATLAQRFRFELQQNQEIVPEPLATLRPRNGISMQIHFLESAWANTAAS